MLWSLDTASARSRPGSDLANSVSVSMFGIAIRAGERDKKSSEDFVIRSKNPGGSKVEYARKNPAMAAVGKTALSTSHLPVFSETSHQEACGAELASFGSAC